MPTYEYRCPKGHGFEVFQRMSDDPVAKCPECGAKAERQISGGAGFLFKGEGFYITDYRSDDYKKKASKENPSNGGSAGSSEKGSSAPSSDASPSKSPTTKPSDG